MKKNFLKSAIMIVLIIVMTIISVSSSFAVINETSSEDYLPGSVIVSLKSGSPSVKSLLDDFDIKEVNLITPGSDIQNVYLVKFADKTAEIVLRAIEVLNKSPYVICAEPDYYQSVDDPVTQKENSIIKGDVNGDGRITINDVTIIQKQITGLCQVDSTHLWAADVDNDNDVTINDAYNIQKYVIGYVEVW